MRVILYNIQSVSSGGVQCTKPLQQCSRTTVCLHHLTLLITIPFPLVSPQCSVSAMVVQSALSYLIHSAISAVCKPDIYYNVVSRNINQRLQNLTLNIHVIFMYLQYDQLPPLQFVQEPSLKRRSCQECQVEILHKCLQICIFKGRK